MEFSLRATTLINLASLYGGKTVSRAEAVATRMREIGLLPKGGRGLNAPALSGLEVGAFFLALAGSERVDDVPQVLSHLNKMVDSKGMDLLSRMGSVIGQHPTGPLARGRKRAQGMSGQQQAMQKVPLQ